MTFQTKNTNYHFGLPAFRHYRLHNTHTGEFENENNFKALWFTWALTVSIVYYITTKEHQKITKILLISKSALYIDFLMTYSCTPVECTLLKCSDKNQKFCGMGRGLSAGSGCYEWKWIYLCQWTYSDCFILM